MTSIRHLGWISLALLVVVGCEPATTPPAATPATPPATPSPSPAASPEKAEAPKGAAAGKLSEEEIAEIKKLPAEDQALALAQVTCPVSGDNLGEGGMGVPIKQTIGDKTFFLCCAGCEKAVKTDPAAVLAKLKK